MNPSLIAIPELDILTRPASHTQNLMVANAAVEQLDMFDGEGPSLLSVEAQANTVSCPICRQSARTRRGYRFYCDGARVHEVRGN